MKFDVLENWGEEMTDKGESTTEMTSGEDLEDSRVPDKRDRGEERISTTTRSKNQEDLMVLEAPENGPLSRIQLPSNTSKTRDSTILDYYGSMVGRGGGGAPPSQELVLSITTPHTVTHTTRVIEEHKSVVRNQDNSVNDDNTGTTDKESPVEHVVQEPVSGMPNYDGGGG